MDMEREIEEMKKTNWFAPRDIELISEKRKDLQAAINRNVTNIEDYRNYIRFEELIFEQIQVKASEGSDEEGNTLSEIVKERLNNVYDTALAKYQSDYDLYLSYFMFCKRINYTKFATKALQNLIKMNPYDAEIWHKAADYLSNDLHRLDVALIVVKRALQIHNDDENLYLDVISLNLRLIENQDYTEVDDPPENVKSQQEALQKRLKPIIRNVLKKFNKPKFLLKLLDYLKKYVFAKEIEETIIQHLKDNHLKDASVASVVVKYLRKHNEFKQALEVVNELLKTNKDNFLFEEVIRLELLLFKDNLFTSESEQTEAEKNCIEKLEQHVDDICCLMSNFEFLFKILSVLVPYDFTKSMQQKIITKLTSEHAEKELVWLSLAQFLKNNDEINAAIKVLHSALNIDKDSLIIITELMTSELTSLANWYKNKPEDDDNRILKEKEYYQNIHKCIKMVLENAKDYNVLITLLSLLTSYDFTKDIQNKIIYTLIKSFSDEELVWHYLAQREIKGLHYETSGFTSDSGTSWWCTKGGMASTALSLATSVSITPTNSLKHCVQKYREGLKKVSDSKKHNLWSLYLDCLIEFKQDDIDVAAVTKISLLKSAFEQACRGNYLSEKHFNTWLGYLSDQEKDEVLEKATTVFPQAVELWKRRLYHTMKGGNETQAKIVFKLGVLSLKEKALPLWLIMIDFYCLLSPNKKVIHAIYQDGIKQPQEVSQELKPKYIEWIILTAGMSQAKKQYMLLAYEEPFCKELHKVMIKFITLEMYINNDMWELPYQLACKQFGKDDIHVWLNYIAFYLEHKKVNDIYEQIPNLHDDAYNTLSPLLFSEFKKKFNELLFLHRNTFSSLLRPTS